MQKLNIHFFHAYSEEAEKLESMVTATIPQFMLEYGIQCSIECHDSRGLVPTEECNASAYNVLQYALNNHIVIIDVSIEEVEGYDIGVNYECITPAASSLDNILAVSRTELPLNFIPCRSNVAPLGEKDPTDSDAKQLEDFKLEVEAKDVPHNDLTTYRKAYTNGYIIAWLKSTLRLMHKNDRLFRSDSLKIDITQPTNEMYAKEMEVMDENMKAVKREKGSKKKSFISYRSKYYCNSNQRNQNKYKGKYNIQDVAKIISERHEKDEPGQWDEPFFYPSGVLSHELMPEIRRWAFVAMPDRIIREADEFWIFETSHVDDGKGNFECGYWDSWWCLGEFLTIIRMKHAGQLKNGFKLLIFNPDTDAIDEIPWEQIPDMTDEQNRELARYFANGDFLEAGYESMENMRKMKRRSPVVRWLFFQFQKRFIWPKYMSADDIKDFKFKYYNESIKSHVYEENFMTDRILIGKEQERGITREEVFEDKDIIWTFLNVNGAYNARGIVQYPGSKIIPSKNLANNSELTNNYFYIFWNPRLYKRTGPNGCVLEKVNVYNVREC